MKNPKNGKKINQKNRNVPPGRIYGGIPKKTVGYLLSCPKGKFFWAMNTIDKAHQMPVSFKEWLIKTRAKKTASPEIFKEWMSLCITRRILGKVLQGERKEKYSIADQIPETKQGIEDKLAEINQRIYDLENSL